MSSKTFDNTKINVEFDEDYQSRININSGENISSLFAKIRRFILDLKTVAFSGSYNDLSDVPDVVTKEYVDPVKSQAAINRTTLGYVKKNLLKNNAVTQTVSGITFTVNDDCSITLNGTATAIIWLQVGYTKGEHFRKEKLIFTGNPSGTGSGNGLEAWYLNSTTGNKYVSIANGNILTESEYDSSGVIVYEFHINQGRTYNNVTFYPMLRYADITDSTYEPYQPSVQEQITALEERIAALGG